MAEQDDNVIKPFRLGDWLVRPDLGEIQRGDDIRPLQPLLMAVLLRLVAARGELVSRDELLNDVWQGRAMSDEPINRCIAELRAALDDDRGNPRYIRTVPKRGYQLVAVVEDIVLPTSRLRWVSAAVLFLAVGIAAVMLLTADKSDSNAPPRILVMPMSAMGETTELLAAALTEELLNTLAQSPDLLVFSRTTTFSMIESAVPPMELARTLGADFVLEGALRLDESRIRITVQLIEAGSEIHVFSRELEYRQDQADALIVEISRSIATRIGEALPVDPAQRELRQLDFAAYRDFIEAKHVYLSRQEAGILPAIQRLKAVVERYPEFAEGHAFLASLYNRYHWWNHSDRNSEYYPLIKVHLDRALELNPDNARARALAAVGKSRATVIREFQQVLVLDPQLTDIRYGLARRLFRAGYVVSADKELSWLQQRDPVSEQYQLYHSMARLALNDDTATRAGMARLEAINKSGSSAWLGFLIAIQQGDAERAADYWSEITVYEAKSLQTSGEQISMLLASTENHSGQCQLQANAEQSAALEQLTAFWQFLFMASTPGCESVAVEMRFEKTGELPNFDIPYLVWLPQLAEFRRHEHFVQFMDQFGVTVLWEEIGPPDFCKRTGDRWVCH